MCSEKTDIPIVPLASQFYSEMGMSTCFVRLDRRATKGRILHCSSKSKGGRKKREMSHDEGGNDFSVSTIDQWNAIIGFPWGRLLHIGVSARWDTEETGQQLVNSKLAE